MEGKQMMRHPEASNCEEPVLSPLGLNGHRDRNPECPVIVTEGHPTRAATLNRQMAATANLKFEGGHGSKCPYLAFLLTSKLLLVVHVSQTQPEDRAREPGQSARAWSITLFKVSLLQPQTRAEKDGECT